jgi:hypothetical protein
MIEKLEDDLALLNLFCICDFCVCKFIYLRAAKTVKKQKEKEKLLNLI